MKERVKQLCKEKGVSMNAAESEMGLAKGYISKLGNSNTNQKTLQKMSEYFGVSVEYLINGKEEDSEQKITSLSKLEELDIMKDVDVIIDKLKKGEEAVLNRIQKSIKIANFHDICTNNVHINTFYLLPTPTKLYIISI